MIKGFTSKLISSGSTKKELLEENEALAKKTIQLDRLVVNLEQELSKSQSSEQEIDKAKWTLEMEHLRKMNYWERKCQELEEKYQESERKYQSLEKKCHSLQILVTNIRQEYELKTKRITKENLLKVDEVGKRFQDESSKEWQDLRKGYLKKINELEERSAKLQQKCERYKRLYLEQRGEPKKGISGAEGNYIQKLINFEAKYNELEAKYNELSSEYSKLIFKPGASSIPDEVKVSGKKVPVAEMVFEHRKLLGKVNSLETKLNTKQNKVTKQQALLKKQERQIEKLLYELEYKQVEIQKMNENFLNTKVEYDLLALSLKKNKQAK